MFPAALERFHGKILVACSGGADSVCLAHGVLEHASTHGRTAHLVYIDHGLRPESQAEGRAVVALAERMGGRGHVREVALAPGASLEAEARRVRYLALDLLAQELEVDWILLGHTASDQAETVLMRILRGTGVAGLAGMAWRRGIYARPLLSWTRAATEAYCRRHDLAFVEDPMNRDPRFTRARIRHRWLPALREENPQLEAALCRLAQSARDQREVLDWASAALLRAHLDAQGALLLGAWLDALPESLAIHLLAQHARQAQVAELEARHLRAILELARGPGHGSAELSLPGARLLRRYDQLFYRLAGHEELEEGPQDPVRLAALRAYADDARFELRCWRPGDRMRPARLKGHSKKLSDLFGAARVPAALRVQARVLVRLEDAEIVWAEHIGPAFGETISLG